MNIYKYMDVGNGFKPFRTKKEIIRYILVGLAMMIICLLIYKVNLKEGLIVVANRELPPMEAGLLAAIVLGEKEGLGKESYLEWQRSGLVHLIVVSGMNVMLIVGGGIEMLAWVVGRKTAIGLGLIIGWGYAGMVGWQPPIIRAILMVSVMYWAQLLGRKFEVWRGLALVVGIMLLAEINLVKSVSFWLTIAAYIGVLTLPEKKWWGLIWINLWIIPILGLVFGKISVVGIVSNLMVIGLMEVVVVLGGVGMMVGTIMPLVGRIILWLVYPMLKYLTMLSFIWGKFPMWEVKFNWWLLIGWYMILVYFLVKNKQKFLIFNLKSKSNF